MLRRGLSVAPTIGERLILEITESSAMLVPELVLTFMEEVQRRGVAFALDDFGAGYTSFSYLKEIPGDLLKIDGSLIVHMNAHPTNIAIVETIVTLAKHLGMKTIAEWAEDCATVEILAEIGVDYVQGYVVAKPQEPSDILAATSAASFITDDRLLKYTQTVHTNNSCSPGFEVIDMAGFKLGAKSKDRQDTDKN